MFCLSCGKKISKISKFCKYCGSSQIIKKKISKKEFETVWTCDYCKTEFPSKKFSDEHEIICANNPKNKKFPFNTNPKKGWIIFWITTITVFVLTCFISAKFVEKGVTLLNRDILSAMFLGNICLGVIAFFGIAFSRSKPKKNKVNGLIKYSLIICLAYLIINPSILALEGYRASQNEEYKNKYYKSQTPIPTPIPQDSTDKLLKDLNDYRTEQKMNVLTLDQEMCQVAERLSKMENLEGALKKTDYIDLCPKCNGVGYAYVENTPLVNVFSKFKEGPETNKVIDNKNYKYACFAINNQRVQLFIGNKDSSLSKTNTVVNNNSGNIECIGPDGKNFWTSLDECKKLNEKWGKPLDYMVNCNIHQDCGGGSRRLKLSECNNSTCCQLGNGWSFYLSREKCKQDQGNLNKGSSNNNVPPSNNTSTQNTSPKVMFNATETSIKGTYYCYENKVNEMVTQQSLVKGERELYEVCKSSSYNQNIFNQCWKDTCSGLPDTSACSSSCYDKAYGECSNYYKTYLEYRSKLDNMRWDNCP